MSSTPVLAITVASPSVGSCWGKASTCLSLRSPGFTIRTRASPSPFSSSVASPGNVDTNDDPALEAAKRGQVRAPLAGRLLAVDDDGPKLRKQGAVELVKLPCAVDRGTARHGQMVKAGVEIGLRNLAQKL